MGCLLKVEGIQNGVQKVVISTSYGHMTVTEMRAIIIVVVISLRMSGIHTRGGGNRNP